MSNELKSKIVDLGFTKEIRLMTEEMIKNKFEGLSAIFILPELKKFIHKILKNYLNLFFLYSDLKEKHNELKNKQDKKFCLYFSEFNEKYVIPIELKKQIVVDDMLDSFAVFEEKYGVYKVSCYWSEIVFTNFNIEKTE